MSVNFIGEQVERPMLKFKKVKIWIKSVLKLQGFTDGNICYIFCSDEYLKILNLKYLNHDYFTDIITFDYSNKNLIQGDMFISVDRVLENADKYRCNLNEEFLRVIVHGLLHLCGFKDETDDERKMMRSMENNYLNLFKSI